MAAIAIVILSGASASRRTPSTNASIGKARTSWPSQPNGAIDEAVLQFRALLMLTHLVQRRLPDVNVRQFGAMRRGETLISDIQCHQHE
jgi:hypothetical protein